MRPFQWSWSRLKNFRACPKRHWHVDLEKDYQEVQGDALLWGNEVHTAMEKRIANGTPLPQTMQRYDHWPAAVKELGVEDGVIVKAENKLAITKEFQATGFFASDTWFRAVVDALIITPPYKYADPTLPTGPVAITLDWKTGAVKPEIEQLGLSSQVIFAHYPDVDAVVSSYVWLGDDKVTPAVYKRDQMTQLWNKLWPEIKVMEDAHRTTTYPPKPGPFCKRYCPVVSCPYHGKGSY
jgi:uncharacterized protein Usg